MPYIFATQSAYIYASKAIDILNDINGKILTQENINQINEKEISNNVKDSLHCWICLKDTIINNTNIENYILQIIIE